VRWFTLSTLARAIWWRKLALAPMNSGLARLEGSYVGSNLYDPTFLSELQATSEQVLHLKITGT
jgi:hypothetical protein